MVFLKKGIARKPVVFVGMSGGVDSSVAAAFLKRRGNDVVGVHLRCYNVDGCAERDAEDARRAAETIGIPFYVMDLEREYKAAVVNYMVDGYRRGLTPNPDVMCNKEIKFGLFLKKALAMGADYIATGHYVKRKVRNAKRKRNATRYTLHVARDENKDQSYFLWTLTQEQLRHCLFPIGEYTKPQVRVMARQFYLPNAEKKDSQGICFLGKVTLADFLGRYIPEKKGEVFDVGGEKVGEHRGVQFYTVGQRHRIGVSGTAEPYYVAEKNARTNTLVVARSNDASVYRRKINIGSVNFLRHGRHIDREVEVFVRIRYRQPLSRAILASSDAGGSESRTLVFDVPQRFPAYGQSAVFYSKNGELIGGGIIR